MRAARRQRVLRRGPALAVSLAALVWASLGSGAMATQAATSTFTAPTPVLTIGQPGHAFVYPFGMAWDPTTAPGGSLLVADYNNYNVKRFTPDGNLVATYGSKGSRAGQFAQQPSELAVNPTDGSFVVAFAFNGYGYMKFDAGGNFLYKVKSSVAYYAPFIAVNGAGKVYLVQSTGLSKSSPNIVLMFDANGKPLGQFGTNGTNCSKGQFGVIRGIDVDSDGNVYVNDVSNHCIQVFSSTGAFEGYFGNKTQLSANTRGLKLDRANNVVYVADAARQQVAAFNVTLTPTNTFQSGTYTGPIGFGGSSCGGGGELDAPRDIAVGPDGSVYVSDYACWLVDVFNPLFAATNPGAWTAQVPTPSIPPAPGGLNMANGVTVAPDGTVYVADTFNQRIQSFQGLNGDTPGAFIQQWGSRLPNLNGPFSLDYPRGVAVSPTDGSVWVSDTRSGYIKQYSVSNGPPATVTSGTIFGGEGVSPGTFFYSDSITVGPGLNGSGESLYIPDSGIGWFQITDEAGNVQQMFPCGTLVEPAVFNGCTSSALDSNGLLYAASYNEGLVDVFNPVTGALVGTIGSTAPAGKLSGPYGVAVYGTTLYVTESGKNQVSAFSTTDGSYLGSWGSKGTAIGQFNRPLGIAVDGVGNIYVSDYGNGRIQVFAP